MALNHYEDTPRQRARLKACRLRGGDACPCRGTACRLHPASFTAIFSRGNIGNPDMPTLSPEVNFLLQTNGDGPSPLET